MIKKTLMTLVVLLPTILFVQRYISFPDTNATWKTTTITSYYPDRGKVDFIIEEAYIYMAGNKVFDGEEYNEFVNVLFNVHYNPSTNTNI